MMSFEDEVRKKKEELRAAAQAEAEERRRRAQMEKALKENGFFWSDNPPVLQKPSPELQALIDEARSSMVYINPKIVRELPDGTVRCRPAEPGESPDTYSLDLPRVFSTWSGDDRWEGQIWFFDNDTVALALFQGSALSNWDPKNFWTEKYPAVQDVRKALISQIAIDFDKKPKPVPEEKARADSVLKSRRPDLPPAKADGCYIATSVYGSYDCPEVRVLRRYRDVALRANPLGRLFVKAYYVVSPFLVKWFGKTAWFQKLWRRLLDAKIAALRAEGISGAAYRDRGARRL